MRHTGYRVKSVFLGITAFALLISSAIWSGLFVAGHANAQTTEYERFRNGEKLTYQIAFEKFENAAYAEVLVVSKGTIEGKPAVELRGRVKSVKFVSAAFYLLDHARTVFASPESGLPLYIRDVSNLKGLPEETISNFLSEPSTNLDLLTLLYRVRENGGAGSFTVLERGKLYPFNFAATGGETVKTTFADFETNVSDVTSSYFDEHGISNVRVNFSTDGERIPVQIRFRAKKGNFRAVLASSSILVPTPTPVTATPIPTPSPTPVATPVATPDIIPVLSADLPFKLGERLEYSVSQSGRRIANLVFRTDSIRKVSGTHLLVLKGAVTDSGNSGVLTPGDGAEARVDPYTLVPQSVEIKLSGSLSNWSGTSLFDQTTGKVTFSGTNTADIPIGTHSLLSFAYAIRSFNLKKSDDPRSPVNDTRVSVFANKRAYILTLRPSAAEKIDLQGRTLNAQMITILTGDPAIDALTPRVWLSTDKRRVPLVFTFGDYKAELIR